MNLWKDKKYPIVISCAKCLAPLVEDEVKSFGYRPIDVTENVVVVEGGLRDVFKLNLRLRCAHRVLVPLLRTKCRHVRELYEKIYSIDWENLLDADGYFSVSSVVYNDTVRDTRLPSLVTKDAIVDRIRNKCNRRPDSGPDYDRGSAVFLHWNDDCVIVYLDTSGTPLSKRGYRRIPGSAPMQETLAAACIDTMHWDRHSPFISPMCGSGTPAIEAALAAMNRAPGSLRSHFAFMSLKGYTQIVDGETAPRVAPRQRFGVSPEQIWKDMVLEAADQEIHTGLPPIIATDISPEAVQNAQTNAHAAGVANYIQFKACDFADTPLPTTFADAQTTGREDGYPTSAGSNRHSAESDRPKYKGYIFFNPEYGIRLGDPAELVPVYERIGTWLNEKCSGYLGAVLTGNPELSKMINLYYVTRIPFYNGPIDCRLFIYPKCEVKGEPPPRPNFAGSVPSESTGSVPSQEGSVPMKLVDAPVDNVDTVGSVPLFDDNADDEQ